MIAMHNRCCIVPPQIFEHIAAAGNPQQRQWAFQNLNASAEFRGERKPPFHLSSMFAVAPGMKRRMIFDAQHGLRLPGTIVRSEGEEPVQDVTVNEAYDGTGEVYDFFFETFGRNSIDGEGMQLDSTVHYRRNFSNAFWNGRQMVFGDGDGEIFARFTRSIDIIGHELTHGITQFESGLGYTGQTGALNESISDVFGILTKQFVNQQTVDDSDWLIGAGLFTEQINAVAIRSMKAPGTAYDDPLIGKDEQPAHMSDYVKTSDDNGGVHINSGIPNKAFYNLAAVLGGYAWTHAGRIWYVAVLEKLKQETHFKEFASMTHQVARNLYGDRSKEEQTVMSAWEDVGIEIK
jgi:Zn-dependent metalloprotease